MWTRTYHRFDNRAAFLAACEAAGWTVEAGTPQPPAGVALDEIGMLHEAPTIGPGGVPVAGALIDARHHVNAAWHAQDVPAAFAGSEVAPVSPVRGWAGA